ncbi:MAG: peptide chain release factor N(5)-glutamine methyltransferase [Ignavibacteria bacterium]|nr:peptide chain release factor N(5)-glutamine methyltransferase [Ignavibacteria bacterium]
MPQVDQHPLTEKHASVSMSLGELLRLSQRILDENNVAAPKRNAEIIICSELKIERAELYLNLRRTVRLDEILSIKEKIKRRISGEPVQYITGFTEFYGLKISVNNSVLIPRPETELLVDKALELIKNRKEKTEILEIGTGSGCIAIALARNSDCRINATDISPEALKTAEENSRRNHTNDKISFELSDVFGINDVSRYDLIISNPPYIPLEEMKSLSDEVKAEPEIALTDFSDGLNFYRKVFSLVKDSTSGHDVLIEIGDSKRSFVKSLAESYGFSSVFYKDYSGIDRVIHIKT